MSSYLRSLGHFCKMKYLYSENANHVRKRASSNCPRYWSIWFDHCKPIPAVFSFQVVSSMYSSCGFPFQRMPRSDLMKVFKRCRFRGFLHVFSSFCQCYPVHSTSLKDVLQSFVWGCSQAGSLFTEPIFSQLFLAGEEWVGCTQW